MAAETRRWIVLEVAGVLLLALALRKDASALYLHPVHVYDEGIILTDAMLTSMGQVPFRDFYTNYPPGMFVTIATVWRLLGTSVLAARVLGLASHLVIAVMAGRLGGLIGGRQFSLFTLGIVGAWLTLIGPLPSAWIVALATTFAAGLVLCGAAAPPAIGRWLAAGALLGVTSWYRLDLAGYATVSVLAFAAVIALRDSRRPLIAVAAGLAVTALPAWSAWLVRGGRQAVFDLVIDQARYTLPARRLPLPSGHEWLRIDTARGLPLPLAATDVLLASVPWIALAPFVALALTRWPRTSTPLRRTATAITGVLSVIVIPQLLPRPDAIHAVYCVTPALVLLTGLASILSDVGTAGAIGAVALTGWLVLPLGRLDPIAAPQPRYSTAAFPRYGGVAESDGALLLTADYLRRHTAADEAIYVGLVDHRQTYASHMFLYFLAERRGGTRYMQLEPNKTNREDVQNGMIADLESRHVRYVVLVNRWLRSDEPNESRWSRSDRLDQYLKAHFELEERFGDYGIFRRTAIAQH
jgi:hypothetical protein